MGSVKVFQVSLDLENLNVQTSVRVYMGSAKNVLLISDVLKILKSLQNIYTSHIANVRHGTLRAYSS